MVRQLAMHRNKFKFTFFMFTVINDHVTYNIKAHNIFIVYLQKEFTVPRTIHTPTFIHHLQLKGNLMQINAAIKTL